MGDLGILGANYGKASGMTWATADFTGDGAVDVGDLGVLVANYGQGMAAPAAVEAPPLDVPALALDLAATPDNGSQAGSIVIEQAPRMAESIAAVPPVALSPTPVRIVSPTAPAGATPSPSSAAPLASADPSVLDVLALLTPLGIPSSECRIPI